MTYLLILASGLSPAWGAVATLADRMTGGETAVERRVPTILRTVGLLFVRRGMGFRCWL